MKSLLLCSGIAILAAIWILATSPNGQSGDGMEDNESPLVLRKQLEQLETAADRIDDVRALKRLQRAYGYYVDQGMWNQAADLFEPQGTIEIGLDGVYVGQKPFRQYLLAYGGGREGLRRGQLNENLMLQPVVHVAGDGLTAKARWRMLVMSGQLGKSAFWGEGVYENEYVKEGTTWKIKSLHAYSRFCTPYAEGWGKNALPGARPEKSLKPGSPADCFV
jgi:peptidoglycan hydrolase-like protein with peptidoglycan-binding domain